MNFLLKNIESALAENDLIEGEKLLEEGKVYQLSESQRHLWVVQVDGFETEIQISPSRVKACSCECGEFLEQNMCGHVAAGLLALRKKLAEKKPAPSKPATLGRTYPKLTISAIVNSADPNELVAFVGQYAKSNRNFALALKARFASTVPMPDPKEKYEQLLEDTIQSFRRKDAHISAAGAVQLGKTLGDLLGQADDAISLEHFAEGWAILQAILLKIPPLLRKIDGDENSLGLFIPSVLDQMEKMLSLPVPPVLREDVWSFLLQECTRPAYRLNKLSYRLFAILNELADDDENAIQYLQVLDKELSRKALPNEYHSCVLYAKLVLLEKNGLYKQANDFMMECFASPSQLLLVVESAIEMGKPEKVKHLAEKGLRFAQEPAAKMKLQSVLLSVSLAENDAEIVVQIARNLFLDTYDFQFFKLCKMHYKGEWASFFTDLVNSLHERNAPIATLATLLAEEAQFEALLDLLKKSGSLDLLGQFDHLFPKTNSAALLDLYKYLLENYLAHHLGIKPSIKVQAILAHLSQIGAKEVAEGLSSFLKEHYPARLAPIPELDEISIYL